MSAVNMMAMPHYAAAHSPSNKAVLFTVIFTDGTVTDVTAYNPFLIIDGTGYRTAYEPCEALNRFANELLRQRGG